MNSHSSRTLAGWLIALSVIWTGFPATTNAASSEPIARVFAEFVDKLEQRKRPDYVIKPLKDRSDEAIPYLFRIMLAPDDAQELVEIRGFLPHHFPKSRAGAADLRISAIPALMAIEADALVLLPLLSDQLNSQSVEQRRTALQILGTVGSNADATLPVFLQAYWDDETPLIRSVALTGLVQALPNSRETIRIVVQGILANSGEDREHAMDLGPKAASLVPQALEWMRSEKGADHFNLMARFVLKHAPDDANVRRVLTDSLLVPAPSLDTIILLASLNNPPKLSPALLKRAMRNPDFFVRIDGVSAMFKTGAAKGDVIDALETAVSDTISKPSIREIDSREGFDRDLLLAVGTTLLLELSPNNQVAIRALLHEARRRDFPGNYAIESLGQFGAKVSDSLPVLKEMLQESRKAKLGKKMLNSPFGQRTQLLEKSIKEIEAAPTD